MSATERNHRQPAGACPRWSRKATPVESRRRHVITLVAAALVLMSPARIALVIRSRSAGVASAPPLVARTPPGGLGPAAIVVIRPGGTPSASAASAASVPNRSAELGIHARAEVVERAAPRLAGSPGAATLIRPVFALAPPPRRFDQQRRAHSGTRSSIIDAQRRDLLRLTKGVTHADPATRKGTTPAAAAHRRAG